MPAPVRLVPAGPAALDALGEAVDEAKGGDALAPVTVVVARSYVGLAVRRSLARRPGGLVNVRCTTLPRLADELAGAALATDGRLPLTDAVLHAALRRALVHDPGVLAEHVDHPATLEALVAAWRDLHGAPAAARRTLAAASARAASVVRIVERAEAALDGYADELEVVRTAAALVQAEPGRAGALGGVVVHLTGELTPPARDLLAMIGGPVGGPVPGPVVVSVVVSLVGDPTADDPLLATAATLAGGDAAAVPPSVGSPTGTAARSAPSPDTEVLACLRDLAGRIDAGVPLHRLGIAFATATPYASLVQEQLALAGVAVTGVADRTLAQTGAGRLLLGALDLPSLDWRRDAVTGWLAGAPVRVEGRPAPAAAWERRSCEAGIVAGLDAWRQRLETHLRHLGHEIDDVSTGVADDRAHDRRPLEALEADHASATALLAFVTDLAHRLDGLAGRHSWSALATDTAALLGHLTGGAGAAATWPPDEQEALLAVEAALGALHGLDALDPAPSFDAFVTALRAELARPAPQTGRFGDGVVVGTIPTLAGLDLDVVWVLGLSDGAYPTAPRRDALLPEEERLAGGAGLGTTDRMASDQRRAYLAALASAPERILSFSRGELRRGRELRPSRWLLDTIGALAGRAEPLYARDLARLGPVGGFEVVASHVAAVGSDGAAVDVDDARLRGLLRWAEAGHDVAAHWAAGQADDPDLHRALDTRRRRAGAGLTRFDGAIDPAGLGAARDHLMERPVSPTRLETYATCGRRYLLGRVLHLHAPDRPEDIIEMAELQRGRLVHEILEQFTRAQLEAEPEGIDPGRAWDDDAHACLDDVAHRVFAEFERRGVTGHPHLWQLDRRAVLRNLHLVLRIDDAHRAARRATPHAAELHFGDDARVTITTPSGRSIDLHGSVDRVDRTESGDAIVIDYKHGNPRNYRVADGLAHGRHLQLPVYGAAAQQLLGVTDVAVGYWITRTPLRHPELVDLAPLLDEAGGTIDVLVDHIEAGLFPARPGDDGWKGHEHCRWCDFDALCPTSRGDDWERARTQPELRDLVALLEPDPDPEPDDGPDDGGGA